MRLNRMDGCTFARTGRSAGKSGGCCFEPISHDLQARLKKAQSELNLANENNARMKEDLTKKSRELEQLKCETGQMSAKRQNAEDHSAILSAKANVMKTDLRRYKNTAHKLEKELESAHNNASEIKAVYQRCERKLARYKAKLTSATFTASRVDGLESENHELKARMKHLEMELGEYRGTAQAVKIKLREATSKSRAIAEKAELAEEMSRRLDAMTAEAKKLDTEKLQLEMAVQRYSGEVKVLEGIKDREKDAVRLEIQVTRMEAENTRLVEENTRLESARTILESECAHAKQLIGDNQLMRAQLETLRASSQRCDSLELQNVELTGKLVEIESLRRQVVRVEELDRRVLSLEREISDLRQKLEIAQVESTSMNAANEKLVSEVRRVRGNIQSMELMKDDNDRLLRENKRLEQRIVESEAAIRDVERLKSAAHEHDRAKMEIVQLEGEINDREEREQRLASKYRYYKIKAKEQENVIRVQEAEMGDLRNHMVRIEEKEARKEAALRRKQRHETQADEQRYKLVKELECERIRNARVETQLLDVKRRMEFLAGRR